MNLLKRGSSPGQRHTNTSSNTNQTGFIPGSRSPPNVPTQNQISPSHHNPHLQTPPNQQVNSATPPNVSSVIQSVQLSMGGEHSAFRALNPTTAALLAASAQLGLARSYAASLAQNNNIASSTSTNQSPPMSPHPSDSEEEINVHDESDTEPTNHNSHSARKKHIELLEHDRNWKLIAVTEQLCTGLWFRMVSSSQFRFQAWNLEDH